MVGAIKPVHKWTILIVDDNYEVADSLRQLLALNGVTVYLAGTGQEGLHFLEEIQPTLVLLDSIMPDMSGEEVLRQIRQRFPECAVPIIAFTASAAINEDNVSDVGYDGYIHKPFSVEQLIDNLRQILWTAQEKASS
jgi:CheY-like chemotaxis protein